MGTYLAISTVSIIISIIIWTCVILAFGLRTRKSEFAMMGGKIEFREIKVSKENEWDDWKELKLYISTDNKKFDNFNEAYLHQKKILSSLKNVKKTKSEKFIKENIFNETKKYNDYIKLSRKYPEIQKYNIEEKYDKAYAEIFNYIDHINYYPKSYLGLNVNGFNKDLVVDALFEYLYNRKNQTEIEKELIPKLKSPCGFILAGTLALYQISTKKQIGKLKSAGLTKKEARELIKDLVNIVK